MLVVAAVDKNIVRFGQKTLCRQISGPIWRNLSMRKSKAVLKDRFLKPLPYILAGFDLTTLNSSLLGGDDTTRPRRKGWNKYILVSLCFIICSKLTLWNIKLLVVNLVRDLILSILSIISTRPRRQGVLRAP
jgi:hypothetical protein